MDIGETVKVVRKEFSDYLRKKNPDWRVLSKLMFQMHFIYGIIPYAHLFGKLF